MTSPSGVASISQGESPNLSAKEALALVAFGDAQALNGFRHSFPRIWPMAALLWNSYQISTQDSTENFEYASVRHLAPHFRETLSDEQFLQLCERLNDSRIEWGATEGRLAEASKLLCDLAAGGSVKLFSKQGHRLVLETNQIDLLAAWRTRPAAEFKCFQLRITNEAAAVLRQWQADNAFIPQPKPESAQLSDATLKPWPKTPTNDHRPIWERENIGFCEIADACALPPGQAVRLLLASFQKGRFLVGGKSVVISRANKGHYDDPTLTWQEFDVLVGWARRDAVHLRKLCEDLEIPRAHALRWFQARQLPLPDFLFSEGELAAAMSETAALAGQSAGMPASTLTTATDKTVHATIDQIYCHAERFGMKAPNVKELFLIVEQVLAKEGKRAGRTKVAKFNNKFANRRRKPGQRLNGSLPAFSLEGWGKSGPES